MNYILYLIVMDEFWGMQCEYFGNYYMFISIISVQQQLIIGVCKLGQ